MKQVVKLYGSRGAGSAAVEMGLKACALDYELVRASQWEPDSALEELGRVNPLKQIPTLVLADGTVMSESAAILLHLGLAYPQSGLLPTDAAQRARVLRGLVYIPANCYSAISVIDYPERWTTSESAEHRDQVRAAARAQLHHKWDVFADTMAGDGPYLTGSLPGALDFLAVVVSRWSGTRAHLQEHRPAFHDTLQRIERQPLVAQVVQAHWPA